MHRVGYPSDERFWPLGPSVRAMRFTPLEIPDVVLVDLVLHNDDRGTFVETYREDQLSRAGIVDHFVQDNVSVSLRPGTVRGLHFQAPPRPVAKLVRVARGSVFDVSVDLRRGSPTFGEHVSITLTASRRQALYVPRGFAHGFCTLQPETEVAYKVTAGWSPAVDRGLLWNDPALGITWPVLANEAILSEKDSAHPVLADLDTFFGMEEE